MLAEKTTERVYTQNEMQIITAFNEAFKDVLELYSDYIDANKEADEMFKILNFFHKLRNQILKGTIDFDKEFKKNPFLEALINQKLLSVLKNEIKYIEDINIEDMIKENQDIMEKEYDSFINKNLQIVKF